MEITKCLWILFPNFGDIMDIKLESPNRHLSMLHVSVDFLPVFDVVLAVSCLIMSV